MQLHRILALALVSTAGLWAAEHVSAYRAQLNGASGPANGVLVTVGDNVVFVDTDQPDASFAIPRGQFSALTVQSGGIVVGQCSQPYTGPFGETSSLNIRFMNSENAAEVVRWIGVPGTSVGTDTAALGARPGSEMFPVMYNNDTGRLVITPSGIDFEDITNRAHSQHWTYGELKGVQRMTGNEIAVKPYHGDTYKFTTTQMMDNAVYNSIADHIAAAQSAGQP